MTEINNYFIVGWLKKVHHRISWFMKNKKIRITTVNGGKSKDKVKKNRETDKNIKKTTTNQENKSLPRKIFILGDSIVKEIDGRRLWKRMKGTVAVRSIPGATTKGMLYHIKDCIADCTPSIAILHHGTNDVSTTSSPTEIASSIIYLVSDTKRNVNEVTISALAIRNGKWVEKRKGMNEKLKKQGHFSGI